MNGRALFAVDAGGSRTRALVRSESGAACTVELPSINPHSTGATATATLVELLATVRDLLDGEPATGWLASAAAVPDGIGPELARADGAARHVGLAGTVVVSNDKVPLLCGVPALAGTGVVTVCGTGSGHFGADRHGRVTCAGGCEYLGSDEGSAADIGLHGLRAAVRATDGRGPATALVTDFEQAIGAPVATLARRLAADPFPKRGLAALAPVVCDAWLSGDEVASAVVHQAVSDLVAGTRAVRDALELPPGFSVAATGGVFTGCPPLYREFAGRVVRALGAISVDLVTDTVSAVLAAADRFHAEGRLGVPPSHAGVLTVQTPRREHVVGTVPGGVR